VDTNSSYDAGRGMQLRVFARNGLSGDLFGRSLATCSSGTILVVGSPGAHGGRGVAHFCAHNLTVCGDLAPISRTREHASFGSSVAVSKDATRLAVVSTSPRKMFTSDWEYVVLHDLVLFVYDVSASMSISASQTLIVSAENEGDNADTGVCVGLFDRWLIIGMPWFSFGQFAGRVLLYQRGIQDTT
jgi:hypothetical protein